MRRAQRISIQKAGVVFKEATRVFRMVKMRLQEKTEKEESQLTNKVKKEAKWSMALGQVCVCVQLA